MKNCGGEHMTNRSEENVIRTRKWRRTVLTVRKTQEDITRQTPDWNPVGKKIEGNVVERHGRSFSANNES